MSAYIGYERSKEDMEGRVCTCPETGHPDEYGDGSSLPCMSDSNGILGPDIHCSNCSWCQKPTKELEKSIIKNRYDDYYRNCDDWSIDDINTRLRIDFMHLNALTDDEAIKYIDELCYGESDCQ